MRHARRQAMAQTARKQADAPEQSRRRPLWLAAVLLWLGGLGLAGLLAINHPATPLPAAWNPTKPLAIADPLTPLTGWKLAHTAEDPTLCLAALAEAAMLTSREARRDSPQCYINDRVDLARIGKARLAPVETRCAIALRLAMWETHSLQPAAQDHLNAQVTTITHAGSYNCRPLRSTNGPTISMSTHATGDAIDITGFILSDGREISLLQDWASDTPSAAFLRDARDGACRFFALTLSPDYNRLHADHFHLQSRGGGLCR